MRRGVRDLNHYKDGPLRIKLNRRFQAVAIGVVCATMLAIGPGMDHAVVYADVTGHSIKERMYDDVTDVKVAQFEIPKSGAKGDAPAKPLPKRLKYQYGYGSESSIFYRKNPDLNEQVQDDLLILTPEVNGYITYRPTDWLEATLEVILQYEYASQEEFLVILPDGSIQLAERRGLSLLVDQAHVTFKDKVDLTLGRRNFEDDRHWLYDASLDVALLSLKLGKFRFETSFGRVALINLDAIKREVPEKINTWITYGEFRGFEDIKLAGYAVLRHDVNNIEGRPWLLGVRSLGHPTRNFSYWADVAFLAGRDEDGREFSSAYGFDVGATYRFSGLPLNPNLTLGFAFGTGDDNQEDNKNNEFRQTGIQSNESKFAGISDFKYYGEALTPVLSNLEIFSVGLGLRPAHNISFDFIYHHYRLDALAEESRTEEITALMNQLSRDVGSAFDVVLGFRNLFGVRRLGLDLRAGWFFPGEAFLRNDGDEDNPIIRKPDDGFKFEAKFWW
jgi:alginate production protein